MQNIVFQFIKEIMIGLLSLYKPINKKNMYSIVNNLENKVIANLSNDRELIDKVSEIVSENGNTDFSVIGISDAKEYIEDYCSNLDLMII